MKFIKKLNEKEKYLNYKSAHNAFLFYAVTGFIWSIYTSKEALSWQHTIWLSGMLVFLFSRLYFSEKINKEQDK